jgi:hypothetical protein
MAICDSLNGTLLAEIEPLPIFIIAVEPVGKQVVSGLGDSCPPLLAPSIDFALECFSKMK